MRNASTSDQVRTKNEGPKHAIRLVKFLVRFVDASRRKLLCDFPASGTHAAAGGSSSSSSFGSVAFGTGAALASGSGLASGDFASADLLVIVVDVLAGDADFAAGGDFFAAGTADDFVPAPAGFGAAALDPTVPAFDGAAFDAGAFPATRYLRILSKRFGPMPRTASKSSTLLNGPYDLRICKILSAVAGPIPGTCCNCSDVAVFKLTGAAGGFFFAAVTTEQNSRQATRGTTIERRRRNMAH
jgi:hypothetical protein